MTVAYTKTADKVAGTDDVLAKDYNDLRAEVKCAVEGIPTHDLDITIANTGGSNNDLPEVITATDDEGDANLDISYVATITYDGSDLPTSIAYVFSVIGITVTVAITYTSGLPTAITRTLS